MASWARQAALSCHPAGTGDKQLREVRGAQRARREELSRVAAAAPRRFPGSGGLGATGRSQRRCPPRRGEKGPRGRARPGAGAGKGWREPRGRPREPRARRDPGEPRSAALAGRGRLCRGRAGGPGRPRRGSYLRCDGAR